MKDELTHIEPVRALKILKMEIPTKSQLKEVANKSDFARLMNISRTTVYDSDDIGLLIHTNDGKKIDLIKTLRFWEILDASHFTLFKYKKWFYREIHKQVSPNEP